MAHSVNPSLPDTLRLYSNSSPRADEVKRNSSPIAPTRRAGTPAAPTQVILVAYFGHEIVPVPRQVRKWPPGRLQGQISKAEKALQVSEPIPAASFWVQGSKHGCGNALKEEEILLDSESQTWQGNLCLPSFALLPSSSSRASHRNHHDYFSLLV